MKTSHLENLPRGEFKLFSLIAKSLLDSVCSSSESNTYFLSVEELKLRLGICKQKCNYFRKHGKRHCQQHLDQCLEAAKDRADDDAEQKILAIIQWEKIVPFGKG
jgi:hypothetical protein